MKTGNVHYLISFLLIILLLAGIAAADMAEEQFVLSSCSKFREEISISLTKIDAKAALVSLHLGSLEVSGDGISSHLDSIGEDNPSVIFSALSSEEGIIVSVSQGPYSRLVNTSLPYTYFDEAHTEPYLTPVILSYHLPPEVSQTVPPGRDLIWPVRTREGKYLLVIHFDDTGLVSDAAEMADINPELFSVVTDQDAGQIWCSDPDELMSVPPDDILTEFPTFRDVRDLIQYTWTGSAIYDVWKKNRVRTGGWSSIRYYNQVWKVFVAE